MAKEPTRGATKPTGPKLIFMTIGKPSYIAYAGDDPELAQRIASAIEAVVISIPVLWDYRKGK